jgi:Protein of unknown function (DUF2510)
MNSGQRSQTGAPRLAKPGWFPDPGGGVERWWSGRGWTTYTRPLPQPKRSQPRVSVGQPAQSVRQERRRGRLRRVAWLPIVGVLIAVTVAGIAMSRGQEIKSVGLSGSIEFYEHGDSRHEANGEYERRQERLDERLSELEKAPPAGGTSSGPESADISGVWRGDPGISYLIQQAGATVYFSEQGAYGQTAIGYGTIVGARFTFQFEALNGSSGTGELILQSDDGSLAGGFRSYQGTSGPLRLIR